jgi:hypothetical protein
MRNVLWILCLLSLALIAPVRAQRGNSPFATSDPLAKALQQSNVYVGKTLRGQIDEGALRAIADRAPSDRPLKIAVVRQLPETGRQYGTRDRYTQALHDYLRLGSGTLLITTQQGVSVATDALTPQQISQIVQQNTSYIQNDPVDGIRRTVDALYARSPTMPAQAPAVNNAPGAFRPPPPETGGGLSDYWWLLPVAGVGGGLVWWGKKAADKRRAMLAAMQPVQRLHREVVEGISYADNYLDLLPASDDATAARQARQEAAALLEQAKSSARAARTPEDYGRAQALLEQAQEQVAACRKHIDIATGGTGVAVAVEGTDYKATPATATQAAPVLSNIHPDDIPENERAACFFCSRPARISDLTPVTITLNGQRRKVLACADDVRIIQNGATPEVRTVEENGRSIPWSQSRAYDPYRDYNRYPPVYAPGYGSYDGGFFSGLLLGSLISPPVPMAYPVFVTPSGYATNDWQAADPNTIPEQTAGGSDDPGLDHVGGADFFGVGGNNAGDSGDFGTADFGGSDFGGSDFGGSDFGGSDFGGSDFGGGDSGGGGDY